jgi:phytoene desaturase
MSSSRAIIIGSGIGGIATAIRLAVMGYRVDVFERNEYPGGKLSAFAQDGFQFDAGPSLFTQPQNIESLFAFANEDIADYFQYMPVEVVCHYFFENGKRLKTYANKEKLTKEFEEVLGEKPAAIDAYLNSAATLYEKVGKVFLHHSLHRLKTWLHSRTIEAIRHIKSAYLFDTLHAYNKKQFQSKEAIQIFNRFATYNGSNPYKAPAMLSLIPHLEQNMGTFYPKGGMISITNSLVALAKKKGVQFHYNENVEQIKTANGKAIGVVSNKKYHSADIVVSNGDVYHTYKNLLDDTQTSKAIQKQERSSSALIFYWGVTSTFSALGLHNILFSEQYEEEFDFLFQKKQLHPDPTIYINITSKMEPSLAPEGGENWFVMINAPTNIGQDWYEFKKQARESIIKKINRILKIDLASMIATESILDPVTIEQRTGTFQGSLYGTSSNSKWAAFLRPANFSSKIKGLYFCGGTVHPGGGIPLCLHSAEITAALIKDNEQQ